MKGSYEVTVYNKDIHYKFTIKRNITVIRGDSATGKTKLFNLIRDYDDVGNSSGIILQCQKRCTVLSGANWKAALSGINDSIVFIDEQSSFINSVEFSDTIKCSNNYFVIITREKLAMLPYSVEEVYGIYSSGKYTNIKNEFSDKEKIFNVFYPIYENKSINSLDDFDLIITEDSNSGFEFFGSYNKECLSANGKSNIKDLIKSNINKRVLVIADGAAFGPEMLDVDKLLEKMKDMSIFLPESFEWLILKTGDIKISELNDILQNPEEYIESTQYFSWENFFSFLLHEHTIGSVQAYTKSKLNPYYLGKGMKKKIENVIKQFGLDFNDIKNDK
ncbi:MAG: translation initiation factor 2 [Lachnospiraceae bacterium]|nr:translation initiation factor 2 [Lachnospiraceae bacterium]